MYETPEWAADKAVCHILMPKFGTSKIVWEPCVGGGRIKTALEKSGYKVIGTDLYPGPSDGEPRDFLKWQPEEWDIIMTNPPYGDAKNKCLQRAIELGKPWLMLMPLDTLTSKGRHTIFSEVVCEFWMESTKMYFTHNGEEVNASTGMMWIYSEGERSPSLIARPLSHPFFF